MSEPIPRRLRHAYGVLAGLLLHGLGVLLLVDVVNDTLRNPDAGVSTAQVLVAAAVGSLGLTLMLTAALRWALGRA
jgi:hypothetical protein